MVSGICGLTYIENKSKNVMQVLASNEALDQLDK